MKSGHLTRAAFIARLQAALDPSGRYARLPEGVRDFMRLLLAHIEAGDPADVLDVVAVHNEVLRAPRGEVKT